ncbi:WD40 repeat-like protein [Mycena belliarum]|uniref:WD40 repeat-like protein n=1 Tax=Mycena belliarum TaxID=1033014 RepID=A0AAD6U5E6_9AGAR|nr:WD40 repeat-like protein [Mycena belliae]
MFLFPHSQLLFAPSQTVVISGPHIQLLDSRCATSPGTGAVLATTADRPIAKAGPIRVAAVDSTGTHLATAADDKQLRLWRLDGLTLLNERELPKKPTELAFTRDGQTILASDKFGDIFSYALHPTPQTAAQKSAALKSHENPSGGALVLGHASFLTAFLLSPDEKFILTADRDEHIRVSWFPQGYTIETYCFGHQKFVSALHLPPFAPALLVSGGGDPTLKVWDWIRGACVREVSVQPAVAPFIKVMPPERTPRRFEDDGGADGEERSEGPKKRKRGRKQKMKERQRKAAADAEGSEPAEPEADADAVEAADASEIAEPEPVFALRRIESLPSDAGGHLIFSAVGATALFACRFPTASSDTEIEIDALDLGAPVLDFSIATDERIWVCLDAQWEGASAGTPMVRVVRLAGGKLELVDADAPNPLLAALNSACVLPATSPDLRALDLYLALSALPKNRDAAHDPMDLGDVENPPEELSAKELGRLKSKRALAKRGGGKGEGAGEGEGDEPASKRARSDQLEGDTDVVMGGGP